MDERKRVIKDLESRRRETTEALNLLYKDIGESVLLKLEAQGEKSDSNEIRLGYRQIQKEINDSRGLIKAIQENMVKLKEVEEGVHQKEHLKGDFKRELALAYAKLGETVIDHPDYPDFSEIFSSKISELSQKINDLENEIESLNDTSSSNVFNWIGKSIKLVLRNSSLKKYQENLVKMYYTAGEKFLDEVNPGQITEDFVRNMVNDLVDLKSRNESNEIALNTLKSERRKIGEKLNADGGPSRKIDGLENHIRQSESMLNQLYQNFGKIISADLENAGFTKVFDDEDRQLLSSIKRQEETILLLNEKMEKLHASIRIDELKGNVEKYTKLTGDHRQKISQSELAIEDLEKKIREANQEIEDLKEKARDEPLA